MIWIKIYKISGFLKRYLEDQCEIHLSEHEKYTLKFKLVKRWQFIGGRIIGKLLIADALEISPKTVEIRKEYNGAPIVFINKNRSQASISISHTDNFIACAFSKSEKAIGIDIEEHKIDTLHRIKKLLYLDDFTSYETILDHWVVRESLVKASHGKYSVLEPINFQARNIEPNFYIFKANIGGSDYFSTIICRSATFTVAVGVKTSEEDFLNFENACIQDA